MTGIKIFTILFVVFIVAGVTLLVLGTLPASNKFKKDLETGYWH